MYRNVAGIQLDPRAARLSEVDRPTGTGRRRRLRDRVDRDGPRHPGRRLGLRRRRLPDSHVIVLPNTVAEVHAPATDLSGRDGGALRGGEAPRRHCAGPRRRRAVVEAGSDLVLPVEGPMTHASTPTYDLTSTPVLVRSTIWNALGQVVPAAVALVTDPHPDRERAWIASGSSTLAWMVVVLRLPRPGAGRALTKLVAEDLGAASRRASVRWSGWHSP